MFRFLPYLLKTLWRHRTRTLLTVSGSAVALFVFSFVLSVQVGLKQLTEQDDSVLIVFQANKFCPATSHLPEDYELKIREIPGVSNLEFISISLDPAFDTPGVLKVPPATLHVPGSREFPFTLDLRRAGTMSP